MCEFMCVYECLCMWIRVIQCVCMCDVDHAESVSLSWGCGGFLFSPPVNFWGLTAGNRRGCSRVGGTISYSWWCVQFLLFIVPVSLLHFFSLLASLFQPLELRNNTETTQRPQQTHIFFIFCFSSFLTTLPRHKQRHRVRKKQNSASI